MDAFCTRCGRTCSAGRVPWLCCPWHCWHRTWRVMSPGHPQPEETPTHRPRPQLSAAPHFSNSVTSYNVTLLSFLTRHGDSTPLSQSAPHRNGFTARPSAESHGTYLGPSHRLRGLVAGKRTPRSCRDLTFSERSFHGSGPSCQASWEEGKRNVDVSGQ